MNLTRALSALFVVTLAILSACSPAAFQGGYPGEFHTADSQMPIFENRLETEHFVLKWTAKSSDSRDNISDPGVIRETADYLETAWDKYFELFGRKPYTPPGSDKVEVVFRDMDCYGVADPPDGPIQFNSGIWMKMSGVRRPTSAHELFHKLQYAYGYKTRWLPEKPYMWFSEGTAAWSEVFVWGRVSRTCKADEMFKHCDLDLYYADDMAMPFWIYFVRGNRQDADNRLMVRLFEKCEELGNVKEALNAVIQENYGSVDKFYADFAKARKSGFWAGDCGEQYKCILDPDGKDLVNEVKSMQKRWN